jgi:hypothetical protein
MAHQTLIATEWLLSNRTRLDARFLEFSWQEPWGLPIYDFEVSLLGGKHLGRGTDKDEQTALAKAVSEAIERMVCFELNISTQGVAAHPSLLNAEKNAVDEALERALFQYHLANALPFGHQMLCNEATGIIEAIEKNGGSVSLKQMLSLAEYQSCVSLIQKDGYKFLGLGLGQTVGTAQTKSLIEALRNFAAYSKNPKEFPKQVQSNSDLWNCNPIFFETHRPVFEGGSELNSSRSFQGLRTSIEILNQKVKIDFPISVVRAEVSLEALL